MGVVLLRGLRRGLLGVTVPAVGVVERSVHRAPLRAVLLVRRVVAVHVARVVVVVLLLPVRVVASRIEVAVALWIVIILLVRGRVSPVVEELVRRGLEVLVPRGRRS